MCDQCGWPPVSFRPVRDAASARYQYAQVADWESGQVIARGGVEGSWRAHETAIRVSMVSGRDAQPLLTEARMPYLDPGALLVAGAEHITAAARVLDDYGVWVAAVDTVSGRTDLAIFLSSAVISRGDSRERLEDPGLGTYHFLSPAEPNTIRELGAFRHVDDPRGTLYLSDHLVAQLSYAGVLAGTSFAICAPLPFDPFPPPPA